MSEQRPSIESEMLEKGNLALKHGDFDEAIQLFEDALAKMPAHPAAIANLALAYHHKGQPEKAIALLTQCLQEHPENHLCLVNLGKIYQQTGQYEQALKYYYQAVESNYHQWLTYYHMVECYLALDQAEQALNFLKNIPLELTEHPKLLAMAGKVHEQLGNPAEALDIYYQLTIKHPAETDGWFNRAKFYLGHHQYDEAEIDFLKVVELNANHLPALRHLITLKINDHALGAARHFAEIAARVSPDITSYYDLALVAKAEGLLKQTIEFLKECQSLSPNHQDSKVMLAICKFELGNIAEAKGIFQEAFATWLADSRKYEPNLLPENIKRITTQGLACYAQCCLETCDWKTYRTLLSYIQTLTDLEMAMHQTPGISPFYASYMLDYAKYQKQISAAHSAALEPALNMQEQSPTPPPNQRQDKRVKIAYIGSHFHDHPLGIIINALFQYHRREKFEVYAFSLKYASDEVQKTIKDAVDHFIDLSTLADHEAASLIRQNGVDILIDFDGFCEGGRPGILMYQPAPMQCHAWTMPLTMGHHTIQYHINHPLVIPQQQRAHFSEQLIELPRTPFACPGFNKAQLRAQRSDYNLPEDKFVFVSFNRGWQIEPEVFDCWMEILRRVPESVLWLSQTSNEAINNLKMEAECRNIDPNRLIFRKEVKLTQDWHLLLADLWLDTFNYSSDSQLLLSLWGGLPAITKLGVHPPSRLGASFLQASGLDECICHCNEEYVDKAVALASNTSKIVRIQKKLNHIQDSALFHPQQFIMDLENALIEKFSNSVDQQTQ